MMSDDDLQWLVQQLVNSAEVLGQQLTPKAAALMADDLSVYPMPMLARALSRVRNEHMGRLTPKAIIDRIDESVGRPAANEAWAIACTALDESQTLVWNNEISDAWSVARPIAEARDLIGARMAFIAAYERIVRNSRETKALPNPIVSVGWDKSTTEAAVEKALAMGYVSPEYVEEYFEDHLPLALPAPTFDGRLLLTGRIAPAEGASPEFRERLAKLRDEFAVKNHRFTRKDVLARAERMRLSSVKRATAARVADALAAQAKGGAL